MKCRRAKGLIYDFIDGDIDDRSRVALEQHLRECKSCEDLSVGLTKSLDLLHQVEPVEPDENFTWKVRLRLARERNALIDPVLSQRSWARSWNRRFAVGALPAFVLVLATTYFVSKSSLFPTPASGPLSRLTQVPQKNEAAQPIVTGETRKRPGVISSSSAVGERFVANNRQGHGDENEGVLKKDPGPLDLDSLRIQYQASTLQARRLRSAKEQIDLLNEKLRECGERCGGDHKDHETKK